MRPSVVTQGIVLARTNYAEADRILTFLTPDQGKLKAMAKGVRKSKSKLAGGIELFSISDITYIPGRSEINTLISTRLKTHYGNIVKEIERTNAGYEIIRIINRATEEAADETYFELLHKSFEYLDNLGLNHELTSLWFNMQLLKITGHTPNLQTDTSGEQLEASKKYDFHFGDMKFGTVKGRGSFDSSLIKFLRLGFQAKSPRVLDRVEGSDKFLVLSQPLVLSMLKSYVRI